MLARLRRILGLTVAVGMALVLSAASALGAPGGGSGGYSGGGGGGSSGGGGSGGTADMPGWAWGLIVVVIFMIIAVNLLKAQGRTGRATGPARLLRRKREEKVELAAEGAAMDDAAFTPESVKSAARDLHQAIVEAWTGRDRAALASLVGGDLMVEWGRRLDDFDRKGWHNITERLSEPAVEYRRLAGSTASRV